MKVPRPVIYGLALLWFGFLPAGFSQDPNQDQEAPPPVELEREQEEPEERPLEPERVLEPRRPADLPWERGRFGRGRTHSATIAFRRDVTVEADEANDGIVAIGGNVDVQGEVAEAVVVVFGSAKVDGVIQGDLCVVFGAVELGPKAVIEGHLFNLGGPFRAHPDAEIYGERTTISLLGERDFLKKFDWLRDWVVEGFLLARPLPHQVGWARIVAACFVVFYVFLSFIFPQPVSACTEALSRRPAAAFFLGLLTFILLGPVIFLLVVSVAGIIAIPILICALIGLILFGKTAVYCYAGRQIAPVVDGARARLPLMVLIGALLFFLLYMVPVLGFIAWGTATILGLGSVLLAAVGAGRPAEPPPPPIPVRSVPVSPSNPSAPGSEVAIATQPGSPAEPMLLSRVGFWRRLVATFLDFVLLGFLLPQLEGYFLLVWAAYHVLMWSWKGTTIGGIVMGIKIVRIDGSPLTFPVAFVRSLSSFFSAIVVGFGFFWAAWDKEKQAWHDKIAGTIVVQVPKGVPLVMV